MTEQELEKEITKKLTAADLNKDKQGEASNSVNLNFFSVLDIADKELVHSKFIAFLLDPKSCNSNVFLDIFIEKIKLKKLNKKYANCEFSLEWVKTETEHKITNGLASGIIDIFIENSKGNHLIIENKIYAMDQKNQLERYNKAYSDAQLIYLTLNGKKASSYGRGKIKHDKYIRISYIEHIKTWLISCGKYLMNKEFKTENDNKILFLINEYICAINVLTRDQKIRDCVIPLLIEDIKKIKCFDGNNYKHIDQFIKEITGFKDFNIIRKLKAYIIETKFYNEENSFLNILCKNKWEWELNDIQHITKKDWGFYIYKFGNPDVKVGFKFKNELFKDCVYSTVINDVWQKDKEETFEIKNWDKENFYYDLINKKFEEIELYTALEKTVSKILNDLSTSQYSNA